MTLTKSPSLNRSSNLILDKNNIKGGHKIMICNLEIAFYMLAPQWLHSLSCHNFLDILVLFQLNLITFAVKLDKKWRHELLSSASGY